MTAGRIDPWDGPDRAWRAAKRAYERTSHQTKPMLSMESRSGGLASWCCPECSRFGTPVVAYTVSRHTAPLCGGGKEFL